MAGVDAWCSATFEDDRDVIFECERFAGHEGPHRGAITHEWIEQEDE